MGGPFTAARLIRKEGGTRHRFDDYAIDDVPAIIQFVRRRTGKKPVFLGHSQGGISAILSLMGPVRDKNGSLVFVDGGTTDTAKCA